MQIVCINLEFLGLLSFRCEFVQPPSNFDLPKSRISSFESVPQHSYVVLFFFDKSVIQI